MRNELLPPIISAAFEILRDALFVAVTRIQIRRRWIRPGEKVKSTITFCQGRCDVFAGDVFRVSYVYTTNGSIDGVLAERDGVLFYFNPWELEKGE